MHSWLLPPEYLRRGTVNIDRHCTLDQLNTYDQARGRLFGDQDALDPCQGAVGDADSHAFHEVRMRIVAELARDERADRFDLLFGDGRRLPMEAHQAGEAHRRQYLGLLLERKVAKEVAPKQG